MTVYFSDITEGTSYTSIGRTVTEADIVGFAGLSGDYSQLHTDEVWVRENTEFKGRIAHGLPVLAISNGLRTPELDDWFIQAFLSVERRMTGATYPGDTIHHVSTVESLRASNSRPEAGIVTVQIEVANQHGDVVQEGHDVYLVGGKAEE